MMEEDAPQGLKRASGDFVLDLPTVRAAYSFISLLLVWWLLHPHATRVTQHHNILTVVNTPDISTASVEIIVIALQRLLKQPF